MTQCHDGVRLAHRKGDIFFICCFAFFAFTSFSSDAFHALGLLHGEGFWAEVNRWYARVAADQFYLDNHLWSRYSTVVSGLIFGPFYVLLVYAFIRGANWIRTPALIYVGAMLHGTLEFLWWEYAVGPAPGNPLVFWALSFPYVLVPLLLGVRMWKPVPFACERSAANEL